MMAVFTAVLFVGTELYVILYCVTSMFATELVCAGCKYNLSRFCHAHAAERIS